MKILKATFKPLSTAGSPIYSFTLFGAICWSTRYLYGPEKLQEMLEDFKNSPPFLISDPILMANESLFFPKPALEERILDRFEKEEYSKLKKLKKLKFVSEDSFKKILDGDIRYIDQLELEEAQPVAKKFIQLHASINRITWTTSGDEFYSEFAYQYPAFVVFIKLLKEDYEEVIRSSFRFARIGKNKSTGMGNFDVEVEELKEHWLLEYIKPQSNRVFLLSGSFYDESYHMEKSFYETKIVRSCVDNYYQRFTANIWKKRLLYISAGSQLIVKEQKDFYGGIKVALKEAQKEVYQYGYGFPVFAKERSE